jgi:glucose/arabinose dehydrogenase
LRGVLGALLLVALGSACGAMSGAASPTAPSPRFRVETVARGLEAPWALAFLPDGALLVTERPGRVRLVRDRGLVRAPVTELDVSRSGEAGLLGLALHPDFEDEPFAYVYYTAASGRENRIASFRVRPGGPAGLRFTGSRSPGVRPAA